MCPTQLSASSELNIPNAGIIRANPLTLDSQKSPCPHSDSTSAQCRSKMKPASFK
jgi:hypothetical protein